MTEIQESFFTELYHVNYNKLHRYATAVLRGSPDVEDVVQDTFYEATQHINFLQTHPNPGGWLMQTLKFKLKKCIQLRQRDQSLFLSLDDAFLSALLPSAGDAEPEEGAIAALALAKAQLRDEDFLLLRRFALEGRSHMEIAQELGISLSASQKRLVRIREKLRSYVREAESCDPE